MQKLTSNPELVPQLKPIFDETDNDTMIQSIKMFYEQKQKQSGQNSQRTNHVELNEIDEVAEY